MKLLFMLMGTAFLSFLLAACASNRHVSQEYNERISRTTDRTSHRTTLVFLIDGLPISTLNEELKANHLPQIQKYFLTQKKQMDFARTTFPSLTFPGVGALLTEKPTDQNGLYGNLVLQDGEKVDLESPANYGKLNQRIQGENIFSRLRAKGLKTVSIDYTFKADADASMDANDSEAGLAINKKDYARVDQKLVGSLETLLQKTAVEKWPDFIFVHLVGIDFTSHDQGPGSPEVRKYLEFLDHELGSVFQTLDKVEHSKKREIVALLTADHGYDEEVAHVLNLEQVLKVVDRKMEVLNEGRFVSLYFPHSWQENQKSDLLQDLVSHPFIDIVAFRQGDRVYVQSHSQEALISYGPSSCRDSSFSISVFQTENHLLKAAGTPWACPENLDRDFNRLFYPYFMSNLSHYFQGSGHPDAVIIPKPGVAFKNVNLGQHGGPTSQEVLVPLLFHNGALGEKRIPALWELLRFL